MGEKQDEVKKNNEGEDKNEGGDGDGGGGPTTVVLKFDLHCEGCVKKIKHSLRKTFDGVETVKGNVGSNKLTVVGKVDPSKIKEKVEQKIKKKVELISPQLKKGEGEKKEDGKKLSEENKLEEVKSDAKEDNEHKEPPVSTVVLKTRVHCGGCAQKIRKIVSKRDGVKNIDVDLQTDTITIKGTMNMKELLPYLNARLKRVVELVPPPKKDEGNKKPQGGGGGGGNPSEKPKEGGGGETEKPNKGGNDGGNSPEKPKEGGVSGGNPPEKSKESGGSVAGNPPEKPKEDKSDKKEDGEEKKKEVEEGEKKFDHGASEVDIPPENITRIEINKMDYGGYPFGGYGNEPGYGYNYAHHPRQYGEGSSNHQVVQYWHDPRDSHPPQIFSDENPNACFIM